jgi:tight adherence protein B
MPPLMIMILCGLAFLTAVLVVSAISGFVRAATGSDGTGVKRRLSQKFEIKRTGDTKYQAVLPRKPSAAWEQYIPYLPQFLRLLRTSGTGISPGRALGAMIVIAVALILPEVVFVPPMLLPFAIVAASMVGPALVLMYLLRVRAARNAKFEEQLPDAIDLIVRSLKVGHPLSGAIGVVGRELAAPIGTEFAAASEETVYSQDIPAALAKMTERVNVPDLGYFTMAVQIQQESGGNLVESLAKLSSIVRERFRMFRKVSALFLSVFPLVMIGVIQFIKPDYYTNVMDFPYFLHLVAMTILLLIVNVIAMRIITNLKV